MKEFSWKVFSVTGSIDSYLLFKEMDNRDADNQDEEEGTEQELQPPVH
ncbi:MULTISPECIES: YqzL family protein [Alteribacter]|uniref:YqzL family protein n=1 Tax=Alteribacter keqinensis TaxID=2483800 RepID=A0A3M7TVS5_9BACI|nr:YqzL family protein [Alteribacter keqinensis]MBM7097099.1 YqzL family protein [Alteribacter salitolerans]RNA68874.1 YqzL family protein [Alteribacter keqinensis]